MTVRSSLSLLPTVCRSTRSPPREGRNGGEVPVVWSPPSSRSSPRTAAPGSVGRPPGAVPSRSTWTASGSTRSSLSADEIERYYEGQSNSRIWPLYHERWRRRLRRRWREATGSTSDSRRRRRRAAEGATVWMQDYQLQLVPAMLRDLRPDLRIGFFLHIPFPPMELFMQMPFRAEILRGRLGADLVGFQQRLAAQNFVRLARHLLGLRVQGRRQRRWTQVKAGRVPDLDRPGRWSGWRPTRVQARAKQIRAELGDPKTVILGVDRLDYTKGIELRLKAFRELLDDGTAQRSRDGHGAGGHAEPGAGGAYQALRVKVEREVGRINGDFGRVGVPAVHCSSVLQPKEWPPLRGGRRDDGDPAARRNEPGGQGYVATRTDPAARWCSASSPVPPPSCVRRSCATRTTRTGSRTR